MVLRASHLVLAGTAALLSAPALAEDCPTYEAEYAVSGRIEIRDTPMGRGDGVYDIGPGKTVLRFEGTTVKMLSYAISEQFTVKTRTAFWKTEVATNTTSKATPDACGVVATGTLTGNTIHCTTPIRGYRTDGTLTCSGSFCGDFGVPPVGESQLHIGPADTKFSDFVFAPDKRTFTMAKTPATKTDMPKQTSAVSSSGREVSRTCVTPKPCAPSGAGPSP